MLAGLRRPSAGRVLITGIDVLEGPDAAKRRIGFATGSTGLYGRLSAKEVLTYFGRLYGLAEATLARRTDELSEALGIGNLLNRRCEGLSHGEKQRVSLARALLHDPAVLVLDEPTVGLDVLASRFLRDLVSAEKRRGKAVVFSTHYLAEAALLFDRVGLLHQGRLLREGSPESLRRQTGLATLEEVFLEMVAGTSPAPGEGRA
jgi:sodium transport system ATP-binding protein